MILKGGFNTDKDKMDFNKYQDLAIKTAIYPNIGNNYAYPVLGLCSEAGEVADKIKKVIRDNNGVIDENTREGIKKELGDVLWYAAIVAKELKLDLEEIAVLNIEKLFSRMERGKLSGSGDNR